jgi:O-antigen/teichoic acid export membrane protein
VNALRARWAPLIEVVAGQGVVSATNFATTLALGRFAGEAALGQFALGWSCWFLAMSLGDTLVATPYTYLASQRRPLCDDLVMAAAWGIVLQCLAFTVVLTSLWFWRPGGLGALWPALAAAVVAASVREFVRRHWMAAGHAARVLRLDAGGSLMQLVGLAGLTVAGQLTAFNVFWVIAATAAMTLLPSCTPTRLVRLLAARHAAPRVMASMFGYGRWLLLGGICHVASVQAYPWLAYAAGGDRLAGLFAACTALLNLLAPLLTGLTNYFRPQFMLAQARLPGHDFVDYVRRRIAIFVAPALVLWLMLSLGGDVLLERVYGAPFRGGAVALPWMGLGLVAVALAAPLQLALLALHAPVTNLYYHGSALAWLALCAVMVVGTPSLAALGQAYGAVNVAATLMLVVLCATRRWRHRSVEA